MSENHFYLRSGTRLINLPVPAVMGIVNCTPDSFYAGSRVGHVDQALAVAEQMIAQGADILDIGGMSTRPGSSAPSETEEHERVMPVVAALSGRFPDTILSIDTYRASVAAGAIQAGAHLVNDISAGRMDSGLLSVVAENQVPYVLMHMQGEPRTMQAAPSYPGGVETAVYDFLANKLRELSDMGIYDVFLDPGLGFGKTVAHNYGLLKAIPFLGTLGRPLLIGLSRKSFVYKPLGLQPEEALPASTALHLYALQAGAAVLRVHDVGEARQAVLLHRQLTA